MCVFLCCFVVQKLKFFAKCVTRIFENLRAKQKSERPKKKFWGPADKKRTQFNFLTEKVRARE